MKLHKLALATMLMASAAAMAASPQGPGAVTLTHTVGNLWTASIGDTPALGEFTDVFTFVPSATSGTIAYGSVVNTSYFGMSTISFTSADLNGNALTTSTTPMGFVSLNMATLVPTTVSGPLTLTINGINKGGGSYGGDINFVITPVPEPATYGLMLAGVGMLGFMAWRKKNA